MRLIGWILARKGRIVLLLSLCVGWMAVGLGVALDRKPLLLAGLALLAIANVTLAKALLEIASFRYSIAAHDRALTTFGKSLDEAATTVDGLTARVTDSERDLTSFGINAKEAKDEILVLRRALAQTTDKVESLPSGNELDHHHRKVDGEIETIRDSIGELRAQAAQLAVEQDTTRTALLANRVLTDKLASRARASLTDQSRLAAVAVSDTSSPLLSIAIPSFERPTALETLLRSVADDVAAITPGLIEVCITDDASVDPDTIDIALAFAEAHPYAALRIRQENIGLERNVLAAGASCRGKYLMIVGNDDILLPGSVRTIIEDIRGTEASVLLYAKRRINMDGTAREDVIGSTPIDLPEGDSYTFPTLVDAARSQGLLSTFGFMGPIVMSREPFLSVDPAPYLDLTMYAPLCVMVEAFHADPVFYRNTPTILHRTPTQFQKHAEALGRREEGFMAGGRSRRSRYFGTGLAAALQRLVDRGALDPDALSEMPENLMSTEPLSVWIAGNRSIDPGLDASLDLSVVADADRFSASQTRAANMGWDR